MYKSLRLVPLLLSVCSLHGVAQDPPVKKLSESQNSVPIPRALSNVAPDDPVMQAIRERAGLAPATGPNASTSKPIRRSADRSRIAERLLRQARVMERDANALEQLGETEIASNIRQIAATTREQVVRTLQATAKPIEGTRDGNLPSKTTNP